MTHEGLRFTYKDASLFINQYGSVFINDRFVNTDISTMCELVRQYEEKNNSPINSQDYWINNKIFI